MIHQPLFFVEMLLAKFLRRLSVSRYKYSAQNAENQETLNKVQEELEFNNDETGLFI
ncbi:MULTISPECIES: hypothetical protein [Flavobacteriaceae]|uniref:Uncharacterized protein n=1 Tax=Flagellimonas marinaquae TaxID=254955 RepID=A0AA48HQA6_9FLAO|nr:MULTISPECIES: hypothetical protein [Allomuricauda]USD24701.1 hypothetical protein MJO53_13560 [Allomuricauda aquimarina]BDW93704.1 hypothetical protein MACH07_25360 [Allomuricauda aquimarina]